MSEQEVFNALKYRVVVNKYGTRGYYNSADQLHRTGGPAVEWANGHKEWWINGVILTEAEFNQRVKMSEQDDFDTVQYRIEADEGDSTWYPSVVTYANKMLTLCWPMLQ